MGSCIRDGASSHTRHAIAISTPPFVKPQRERVVTPGKLHAACETCDALANELGALRHQFPL
jgi:hypothetical protein